MNRFRRAFPLLILPLLVVLPSCGSDTPVSSGDVLRSTIEVSVDPNPVQATQNTVTFAVSATYEITIKELAGLGGEVMFVNSSVYDPANGRLVAQTIYDTADMTVFVGQKRVEAFGTLTFKHTVSYVLPDGAKPATLTVAVQVKDDRENVITTSTLVKIE